MNLLFVCSRNQWRSPTAEKIFAKYPDTFTRSAGVSPQAKTKINFALLEWADLIFLMEKRHREIINQKFPEVSKEKLIVLDITDDYQFMDEELIEILKREVKPYLK